MQADDKAAFRAGLFIVLALAVFVGVVFTLGSKQGLWGEQYSLHTSFSNVQGLVVGAPVRLAGLKVGMVEAITFPEAIEEPVEVTLRLDYKEPVRRRIRKNSVASIRSLGPLGEKYIEVSVGEAEEPELRNGERIEAQDPIDFYSVMDAAQVEFEKLTRISAAFEAIVRDFRDSEVLDSLAGIAKSMRASVEAVEKRDGLLHALIYDPKSKHIVTNLASASESFARLAKEITEGDGSLHALIYEKEVAKITQNLASMSASLNKLITEIQEGDGSLHSLVYDQDVQQTVARLKSFSADLEAFAKTLNERKVGDSLASAAENLKTITEKIVAGEGTIGAIVTDPSLYEKTEDLLGGAQRSWMLRRVIRKSIEDGKRKPK